MDLSGTSERLNGDLHLTQFPVALIALGHPADMLGKKLTHADITRRSQSREIAVIRGGKA